jgi:hypothetical protein
MVAHGTKANEADRVRPVCRKGHGGCCCKRFSGTQSRTVMVYAPGAEMSLLSTREACGKARLAESVMGVHD